MVERNIEGDGVVRNIEYANFRTDKPASAGYSAELISRRVEPKYFDDLGAQPSENYHPTLYAQFKSTVSAMPNEPFLGTRERLAEVDAKGKPVFGEYQWKTFGEVDRIAMNLSKGLMAMDLCPTV